MPGDAVAAHLENALKARPNDDHTHGPSNLTNLHYFHGGVVTPRNWGPPATNNQPEGKNGPHSGNGDNIFVHLGGAGPGSQSNTFDFYVPIPKRLDGRVLERQPATSDAGLQNPIEHPSGLNWYHSHLHGYSSKQVMGGMSGLLSIGEDLANVRAGCLQRGGSCPNVEADKKVLAGLQWAPFRESSNNQLLPVRQVALYRDKLKLEADTALSADDKAKRTAEIDTKLMAISREMEMAGIKTN